MANRWTKIEDDYLIEERAEGVSILSVALVLGRSYDAIARRSELLRKREEDKENARRSDQEVFYDLDEGE